MLFEVPTILHIHAYNFHTYKKTSKAVTESFAYELSAYKSRQSESLPSKAKYDDFLMATDSLIFEDFIPLFVQHKEHCTANES